MKHNDKKGYTFSELEKMNVNFEELPENTQVTLDDRHFKYDEKNDRIVRPGEQGYDELPELIY